MRTLVPRLPVIGRVTVSHKRSQDIPIQPCGRIAVRIQQKIRSVIPDTVVNQTAARIASLIRGRIVWMGSGVNDLDVHRIVANNRGVAGGCLQTGGELAQGQAQAGGREGERINTVDAAIGPGRVQISIRSPRGVPRIPELKVIVPAGETDAGNVRGFWKGRIRRRLGWPNRAR